MLRVAVPDGLTALAVLTAFAAAVPPRRRLTLTATVLAAAAVLALISRDRPAPAVLRLAAPVPSRSSLHGGDHSRSSAV